MLIRRSATMTQPLIKKPHNYSAQSRNVHILNEFRRSFVGTEIFNIMPRDMYDAKLTGAIAIVMGTEGKGLRRFTKENDDLLVKIPMCGIVERLNLSVATGIFL